jgi:hypothetical protein
MEAAIFLVIFFTSSGHPARRGARPKMGALVISHLPTPYLFSIVHCLEDFASLTFLKKFEFHFICRKLVEPSPCRPARSGSSPSLLPTYVVDFCRRLRNHVWMSTSMLQYFSWHNIPKRAKRYQLATQFTRKKKKKKHLPK